MIFLSQDGDYLNTEPNDPYFEDAKKIILDWESGLEAFSFKTSGSTGTPQKLFFTRKQIEVSVNKTAETFSLNSDDLLVCSLPVTFTAGKMMILRALVLKADLIILKPAMNPLLGLNRSEKIFTKKRGRIFMSFAPPQITEILKDEFSVSLLRMCKCILLGGAPLSAAQNQLLAESNLKIWEGYGMTETLSHVAIRKISDPLATFTALSGIAFTLSKTGCLSIAYPALQKKVLTTNDIAELITEKTFRVIGRADQVINSGGIKINLADVESKIEKSGLIKNRFFCFGVSDEKWGQKLVLFIENTKEYLELASLKPYLDKYELPKELIFVEKFVETETLKINEQKTANANRPNKIPKS
jgi:o-succinylbenzoate---CoA ligase